MTEAAEGEWAGRPLPFLLHRSARKSLAITVGPDGAIVVRAPFDTPLDDVVARASRRGGWITLQQERARQWKPRTPPRTWAEGETHLYLGRQYRLSVELALAQSVRVEGDRLILAIHHPQRIDERAQLIGEWYLARARETYARRLTALFPNFAALGHSCPRIIVRDLSHRWGSLTAAGNMMLSRDLIRSPRACIDYVIVHELCHLVHSDHGMGFWSLLDATMPDHLVQKQRLERALL